MSFEWFSINNVFFWNCDIALKKNYKGKSRSFFHIIFRRFSRIFFFAFNTNFFKNRKFFCIHTKHNRFSNQIGLNWWRNFVNNMLNIFPQRKWSWIPRSGIQGDGSRISWWGRGKGGNRDVVAINGGSVGNGRCYGRVNHGGKYCAKISIRSGSAGCC